MDQLDTINAPKNPYFRLRSWLFYSDLTCLDLTSTEKGIAYEVDGEAFEDCFVLAGDEAKDSDLIWDSL